MNQTQQLLREYVEGGSETAFQELVARYLDLVYSVALRRVDGDAHRAEDIVQTVFSDLARKARELPVNVMLGGWLHRHCCFVASTLRRTEARREAREKEAMQFYHSNQNAENSSWNELAPLLDEAIQDLDSPDRDAITLRFFERRDLRSIGGLLGTSEDAAQKRVSRALEKLRHLLAERGAVLSVTALAALLEANSIHAAPPGWAGRITANALGDAPVKAGIAASLASLLAPGALKLAAVALVAIGVGTAVILKHSQKRPPPPAATGETVTRADRGPFQKPKAATVSQAVPQTVLAKSEQPNVAPIEGLRLTILSAETGAPIPNGKVEYRGWQGQKFSKGSFVTDDSGSCVVAFPREKVSDAEITTRISPYADTELHWKPGQGDKIPDEYTLRLVTGVPIGGTVVNEQGETVSGAKVGFNVQLSGDVAARVESHNFAWIEVESDASGRWSIDRIAEDVLRGIYGGAQHPEYVPSDWVQLSTSASAERLLREGHYVFRLKNAVALRGLVIDKDRNPVSGAAVLAGPRGSVGSRETTAALDGTFELKGVKPGKTSVTAQAPQYAPKTIEIVASSNSPPIEIVLSGGKILRLHVVNKAGQPIPKANVWLATMHSTPDGATKGSQADFSPKTDKDGRVFWDQAPEGELTFSIAAKGYMRRDDIKLEADGTEHEIVLQPGLRMSGTVRDAETDAPVPSFKIVAGRPTQLPLQDKVVPQWAELDRYTLRFGEGKFDYTWEEPVVYGTAENKYIFKFAADGYAPFISRVIDANEVEVKLDVKLKPSHGLRITVLDPDGQPAPNAEVVFAAPMQYLEVGENGFVRNFGPADQTTDDKGQIQWQPDENVFMVFAASASGFGQNAPGALTAAGDNPVIQLQKWGRIEGTWLKRGQPVTGKTLALLSANKGGTATRLHVEARPKLDETGRFEFAKVPPVTLELSYLSPSSERSYTFVPIREVEVKAGETTTVNISENGVDVVGRIRWPEGFTRQKDDHPFAMLHTPVPQPPRELMGDMEGLRRWRETPEIMAQLKAIKSWPMQQNQDGTIKAETVPPGTYWLEFTLGRPNATEVLTTRKMITITGDEPGGVLDLGEIPVERVQTTAAMRGQ